MTQSDRPGPKRDDPRRIAALRKHGQREAQVKVWAEHEVLVGQVQVGSLVRIKLSGKAKVGRVIGEVKPNCWMVDLVGEGWVKYHKANCVKIKACEASSTARARGRVRQSEIYGDGDV